MAPVSKQPTSNHPGLSGKLDWELADRIVKDEFTFVTNNRVDFVRLFGKMELHAGLIILVPNVAPALQRALSERKRTGQCRPGDYGGG
jgi:hypothetical protein